MLKKLLMIGCMLISSLQATRELIIECEPMEGYDNVFHTYPGKNTDVIPCINASQTYPEPYPPYPGIAYEHSYTTAQIVTTIVVATAFFVIVGIALTNTPKHCGKNCHHTHSGRK